MPMDRVADLFGSDETRACLHHAVKLCGPPSLHTRMYLDEAAFSEGIKVTIAVLRDASTGKMTTVDQRAVASALTLARQLRLAGLAMHQARNHRKTAGGDFPELLAFVRSCCHAWAGEANDDGPQLVVEHIVHPCGEIASMSASDRDQGDAHAALRHLATQFAGRTGFRPDWALQVTPARS